MDPNNLLTAEVNIESQAETITQQLCVLDVYINQRIIYDFAFIMIGKLPTVFTREGSSCIMTPLGSPVNGE